MNHSKRLAHSLALTLALCGVAFAQPASKPAGGPGAAPPDPMERRSDRPPPPDRHAPPDGPDRMPETFDRESVKKRLETRIKELTASQERLQKALEKLDSGAPLTDVWGEIGPSGGNFGDRLRDRYKKGDNAKDARPRRESNDLADGAGAIFNLPPGGGEPMNPEDRDKLFRYLDENMPQVSQRFQAWQKADPGSFDVFLDRMAPRIREAGAVLKRDPDGAKLRMVEIEKGLDVLDTTQKLRAMYATKETDEAKLQPVRAMLKDALSAQMDARYAVHQHQITMLEKQIGDLRKQAEDMSAKKDERLTERAAAFEASIRERATAGPDEKKPRDTAPLDHKPGDAGKPKPPK